MMGKWDGKMGIVMMGRCLCVYGVGGRFVCVCGCVVEEVCVRVKM